MDHKLNIFNILPQRLSETLDDVSQAPSISDLHKKFNSLISSHLIERCEELGQNKAENTLLCPNLVENKDLMHMAVEVDVKVLCASDLFC